MSKKFHFILRIFCLALVLSVFPEAMFSHATPVRYIPAASSVLAKTPSEVRIDFSERIEPRVSSIVVLAPDGSRADLADSSADTEDPRVFRAGLKDHGPGTYTVSWEVISSDDGHFAKGAYVFSVGPARPASSSAVGGFQTVHSSGVPEAFTLALELTGDALILGALIAFAFLWRPMRHYFPDLLAEEPRFLRRFQSLFVFGCVSALLGGIAYLLYKTSELASLRQTAFAGAWVSFLTTASALSTIYRMVGVGVLLATFAAMRKKIFSSARISAMEYAFFLVLALIDLDRARISHAAASTFAPGFGVAMNFVHLFFKDVWIGGIVALVALFSPLVKQARDLRVAAFALTAYSRIASVALGVAGVTGTYVVWLHLKSFSFVLATDWGKRFAVLSIFAGFLLLARFLAQIYCEPKIVDAIRRNDKSRLPQVFRVLGFALPIEMAAGFAILAVTSLLIITTPPLVPHYSFQRSAVSQGLEIALSEQPYETGKFLLSVNDASTATAADVKNMSVTLTNRAEGIGPIAAPVVQ
ncbi:MAG TPA: copper resistance protein CopC, partial [Candidatus Acidoferrales bacterium]|nr:copper resistance protein CopC [Candidatus Acidoferrales bacterium]